MSAAEAIALHPTPAHPPMFSIDAEKSVISGVLNRPEYADTGLDLLDEWMFHREAHRRIWRAIRALRMEGVELEAVAMQDRLRSAGDLEAAGGVPYLAELWGWTPTTSDTHLRHHAAIVHRHAVRRKLHEKAVEVQELVRMTADVDPSHLHAEAGRIMAEATPKDTASTIVHVREPLRAEMERLERLAKGEDVVQGVRTGLRAVDDKLVAMQKGDLIIAAGRPSMGKSAWGVCNVAADAAIRQKKRTVVFSLETRKEALVRRILASEARVNLYAVQKRRGILEHEYPRLAAATSLINTASMHIEYAPGMTLDRMRSSLRELARMDGAPELVIVDYLQLMSVPKVHKAYEEVSAISKGLKEVAGEFEVPVLALSQLSRAVEQRPDKRPMMSDLRESGRLEQDADVIMLLYRPEYYFGPTMSVKRGPKESETINIEGKAEIILTKVREGETGTAHCAWEGAYTHFEDIRGF